MSIRSVDVYVAVLSVLLVSGTPATAGDVWSCNFVDKDVVPEENFQVVYTVQGDQLILTTPITDPLTYTILGNDAFAIVAIEYDSTFIAPSSGGLAITSIVIIKKDSGDVEASEAVWGGGLPHVVTDDHGTCHNS
jgi:hypothetical protein